MILVSWHHWYLDNNEIFNQIIWKIQKKIGYHDKTVYEQVTMSQ